MITSCDESEVLKEVPRNILSTNNLYTTEEGFQYGLNALYAKARLEKAEMRPTGTLPYAMLSMGVDNCWGNYIGPGDFAIQYFQEFNNPNAVIYNSMFVWLYEIVSSANQIINRAENVEITWTTGRKEIVVAEAKVLRYWAYRHLTYMWGAVPLSLEESTGSTIRLDWERTPVDEILEVMEKDLQYASDNLPSVPGLPGGLTSSVADYYLAELYLKMNDPQKAENSAMRIIETGNYSLITSRYGIKSGDMGTPYTDQFIDGNVLRVQGNTEVIWEWLFEADVVGGGGSWLRNYWEMRYYSISGVSLSPALGGRGVGRQSPTRAAIDLYETTDDRVSDAAMHWFLIKDDGDSVFLRTTDETEKDVYWPSIKKWDYYHPDEKRIAEKDGYNDIPYLRLADVYLLLAEALHKQDKNIEAAIYLNMVRERSGASSISAGDVDMEFILDERSRELIGEEHRRYTLLRTGTWLGRTQTMNPISGPFITERDELFPIPQEVLDANISSPMLQNPGYSE